MEISKHQKTTWVKLDKKWLGVFVIVIIVMILSFNNKKDVLNRTTNKTNLKYINGEINSTSKTNSLTSPLPQSHETSITKVDNTNYHSPILGLSFQVPNLNYSVDSMYYYSYGASIHWIQVNEPKIDRSYLFAIINTPDNKPYLWDGRRPYALLGSIKDQPSIDQITSVLKSEGINAQYIKIGTLPATQITYYIAYNKECSGGLGVKTCSLDRMYLIPYERQVEDSFYHTLVFSVPIPLDGSLYKTNFSETEIDSKIVEYWKSDFNLKSFPPETQKIFNTQDQIFNSIVFDINQPNP